MDRIDLGEITTKPIDKPQSSNSESKFNSDADKPSPINKVIELNINGIEELCEVYIKNKYTGIIKSKSMTLIMRTL